MFCLKLKSAISGWVEASQFLACENSRPSSLPARVAFRVPWVPEVFFLVGSDRIERRSREGESRSDEKKPLAPTDNNLTSMPTPVSFD